jgi:AcrR family transcriptional regulator
MPRPRFAKLDPERQTAILEAALHEFAACGFEAASYNRIIDRAGVSKGAMYYYFDDKRDLYGTVVRHVLECALAEFGEPVAARDAGEFWRAIEDFMARGIDFMRRHPEHTSLLKTALEPGPATASGVASELQSLYLTWTEEFISLGERTGALRHDLPRDLLVALITSMAVAGDRWFAEHLSEIPDESRRLAEQFTALMRRALAPDE